MRKQHIVLGVAPTKRSFLSMEEAKRQKDKFMGVIRQIHPDVVEIVDIDDLCENGILYETEKIPQVVEKFKKAGIDALFTPHCDFGEEQCAAGVAAALKVPTLMWGARDERPNTDESRGRDTQCGMFACTKVMKRFGVQYSYIWNCETESEDFKRGFDRFIRVVAVVKTVKNLRIAKFGARPVPFMSVMANEGDLATKFGITVVPVSPTAIAARMDELIQGKDERLAEYLADVKGRMDTSSMEEDKVTRAAAAKLAVQDLMEKNHCTAGAMECWSAVPILGVPICMTLGEMADEGLPISCETDINGAVTLAMLQAVTLGKESSFLADLTIRHPQNDNAELLWHCGPFPYSLKDSGCQARLVGGQERFELKKGDITVCRFDDCDGKYYLFGGEGRAVVWALHPPCGRHLRQLQARPAGGRALSRPHLRRRRRAGRVQFVREGRVMREIHPQALDREAFRPYGDFMDLLRVPQIERREGDNIFAPDLLKLHLDGRMPASVCVARVSECERVISALEYHQFTWETVVAFRVPKGTFVRLNPGVLHGRQFVVDSPEVNVLILLPERTFGNDCTFFPLKGEEQIRITL